MRIGARWRMIVGIWLTIGLLTTVRYRLTLSDGNNGLDLWVALQWALPDAVFWIFLTPIPLALARRFPVQAPYRGRDLLVHLVVSIGVAVTHVLLDVGQNLAFDRMAGRSVDFTASLGYIAPYTTHVNVAIYWIIVGIRRHLDDRDHLQRERARAEVLQRQLAEARLHSLQARLRPHFLFNALHTSSGLVERDPSQARAVLQRIGDLLRRSLTVDERLEIPLREEVDLLRTYLEVERARFGERLRFELAIDSEVERTLVPPFLLQPLVENAVQHGVEARSDAGAVAVFARVESEELLLVVQDDGPGPAPSVRDGIGLSTTRARLAELYGERQSLRLLTADGGGARVEIRLPLRHGERATAEEESASCVS